MTGPGAVLVGGLMSGTSLDGIDAVVLRVSEAEDGHAARPPGDGGGASAARVPALGWRLEAFATTPWPPAMRERIRSACRGGTARELADLHVALGAGLADALLALLDGAGIAPGALAAVGSHGQTVWHRPPDAAGRGATLQLGDPATLAERTGIAVVSDFRARDVAAGGHGAPLVPWPDRVLLHRPGVGRALQNLGGMGNVTFLPASPDPDGVLAFDTGPGVALLDAAARRASDGAQAWDEDGARAARGTEDAELLAALLDEPFFRLPPPRSTGREHFGDGYLEALVARVRPASEAAWDDLLATLTALTAESVGGAYRDFLPEGAVDEVVLTGGGARNPALVRRIARALAPIPVRTGADALGIDPDAREAAAFALLAWAHLRGIPGNLPGATGARGLRVLGSLTPGGGG